VRRLAWVLVAGCEAAPGEPEARDWLDEETRDPCEISGNVCTWLGTPGMAAFTGEGTDRSQDWWTTGTLLFLPVDITFAADGTAYYPDFNHHRIRRVGTDDIVTTVSGTGMLGDGPNDSGSAVNCWSGCDALLSAWNHPTHVALDPTDDSILYVSAWHNSRLNVVDLATSTMTWLAGTGGRFYSQGLDPTTAELPADEQVYGLDLAILDLPTSIAFGPDGTLYFSDQANHLIRKIAPGSTRVEIAAGQIEAAIHPWSGLPTWIREPGFEGDGGDALHAKLHGQNDGKTDPGSMIVSDLMNHRLLIADTINGVIRTYDFDTGVIDTIAGNYESLGTMEMFDGVTGIVSTVDRGSVTGYAGDGGDALEAVFHYPRDVAVGIDGEIYIADSKNHCVRVLRDGLVDRFAGVCGGEAVYGGGSGDGGPALDAEFTDVFGVEVDAAGNVYIADSGNHVIRRVKR
jgi:hypothetical protein